MEIPHVAPNFETNVPGLFIAGEIGRGIAIGLIGYFLLRSGLDVTPQGATGLDGALRTLTVNGWGSALVAVAVVGVGFVAYGVFWLLTFTHRQPQAPS